MNIPNDDKKQTEEWVEEELTPDSYDNDEEDEAVEEELDPAESDDNAEGSEEEREAEDRIAAFRKLTAEEDAEIGRHTPVTLSFILGGDILGGKWFPTFPADRSNGCSRRQSPCLLTSPYTKNGGETICHPIYHLLR